MIDISGHLRDIKRDYGFSDKNKDLVINCCGYQYFDELDFLKDRPNGRLDYQIIYLYKGLADFYINSQLQRLKAGAIIIYKPYQKQYYKYLSAYQTQAYWIHFTGLNIEHLLKKHGLDTIEYFEVGEHMSLCNIFTNIMTELQLKNFNFQDICNSYFDIMLKSIQRLKNDQETNIAQGYIIDNLILQLHLSYNQDWSIDKMAEFCKMSPSRFAHVFKERKKVSAKRFLLNIRLNKAKDFMLNSHLTIKQVSSLIGFEDALYFSRVFKKEVGLSPRQFIKIRG